jgi:O-succinylbenzoic acid--CoA ligase
VPSLVAVPLAGESFVRALRTLWDEGSCAFALDHRLPPEARDAVLARVRPTELWDEQGRRPLAGGEDAADGDAVVLATSGTTSTPQGVVLTHDALAHAAVVTSAVVGADPSTDRWLCCSPLSHAAGLGVVNRALRTGAPLEVHERFDADAVLASDATLTALVPTVLSRIDPGRFRCIVLGGMAMPAHRPPNTVATYGLTETMGGIVYDGRPLPGVEVRLGDGDVVELRSPTNLRCYRTEEGEVTAVDADGWFRTGDLGRLSDDGVLTVLGRADDVIVTGGEKVFPDPVEDLLRGVPGVTGAAVVGRPDPEWGQCVTAVLEVATGATAPTLDAVRALVREHLPPWCAPKVLELVEELPRTVRRAALRSR